MLGHDVSFSFMEVVKFGQQPKQINLVEKRIGNKILHKPVFLLFFLLLLMQTSGSQDKEKEGVS